MRDVENEIRELLRERSREIEFDPTLPSAVVQRSGRRRVVVAAAAGLGVAALGLGAIAGLRALPAQHVPTPPAESPAPDPGGMPSGFVGLRDGELVLASTETSEVLRVLADHSVLGTDAADADLDTLPVRPAVTSDRSAVYFSTFRPGVEGRRLARVPLEGGEVEDLGWGADPAISLDGDRIAYRSCTENGCGRALVVLDLLTGEETRAEPGDGDVQVGNAVWLPDGRLVVQLTPPGDSPYEYHAIDPARPPDDLLDAPSVPTPRNAVRWDLDGYHAPTGGFIVGQQNIEGRVGGVLQLGDQLRHVSVDTETGDVLATVARGSWSRITPVASGQHLLLVDSRGRVYVAIDGGEPQLIAEGFADAAW
jgi:hypothetical protein